MPSTAKMQHQSHCMRNVQRALALAGYGDEPCAVPCCLTWAVPKLGSQFSTPRYSVQKYNTTKRGQECGQQPTCPLQGSKRHTHNSSQIKHFLCTLAHIDGKHTCSSFAYACYDRVMTGVLGIFFVAPPAIRVMAVCQGYPCWLVHAKAGMERPLKLLPYIIWIYSGCCGHAFPHSHSGRK